MIGRKPLLALCGGALLAVGHGAAAAPSRAQQLQDLRVFRSEVFDKDRSYSAADRARADRLLLDMERQAGTLNRAQFALLLGEAVAIARNGHTEEKSGPLREQMNRSPVHFFVARDGIFVIDSSVPQVAVGSRVVRIGDMTPEQLQERLAGYAAGNRGHREWVLYSVLESPELLHALGATTADDRFELTLAGNRRVVVHALPRDARDAERWWGDRELAVAGFHGAPVPLYLKEPKRGYRFEQMPGRGLAYLAFRQNHDDESAEPLSTFASRVRDAVARQRPCFVVVDERLNYGGDLNLTRELMQALPKLIARGGHLYAITGGKTFSAGISSLGYLKQSAGSRLTMVGEPIGDSLEFWAEGDRTTLPGSQLNFSYATDLHTYDRPCTFRYCHISILEHPIVVESLQPQVRIPLLFRDYAKGRDAAFEWILRDIAARRSACGR
jgi:hypothetical protein